MSTIDNTHSASAESFQNAVMDECLANHEEGTAEGHLRSPGKASQRIRPADPTDCAVPRSHDVVTSPESNANAPERELV